MKLTVKSIETRTRPLIFLLMLGLTFVPVVAEEDFPMKFDSTQKRMLPEYYAIVLKVRGEVFVTSKGLRKDVDEETKFGPEDVIDVGERSYLKIKMVDDTLFDLGPRSRFSLDQYNFRTKQDRTSIYQLIKGKARAIFKIPAKQDDIEVRAGHVSMGIRGTEFLFNHHTTQDGNASGDVEIGVLEGQLSITNNKLKDPASREVYILRPGILYDSSKWESVFKKREKFHKMADQLIEKLKAKKTDRLTQELPFLPSLLKQKVEESNIPNKNVMMQKNLVQNVQVYKGPQKKSWKEILKEQQNHGETYNPYMYGLSPGEIESFDKMKEKAMDLPICEYREECVEYGYYYVKGNRMEKCNKKVKVKKREKCKDIVP